ncbi:MAG: VOC family protein, partial [Rhodobacteraceae bacterium]|nr:VOC family protein [Paracoccaceae bacterium]
PPPGRPRWFGLDHWQGPPRLCNWICRCDDLTAGLEAAPQGGIVSLALARGSLNWKIGVPPDGSLSLGGLYPSLLEWGPGIEPPGKSLPSAGARLLSLEIEGPEAVTAQHFLNQQFNDQRVSVRHSPKICFAARFQTPSGERVLL